MLKLSENEYWASFDIRNQLATHGNIDNSFLKNVLSFSPYEHGSLNWNLYPKNFEGAFSEKLENFFDINLGSYETIKDFTHHLHKKVDEHTFLRSYVENFRPMKWGVQRFRYKKGIANPSFEDTKRRFHKKVSYCPACMEIKLKKYGHTYFNSNTCNLTHEGHMNIELIGCPTCHYNHHHTSNVNNSKSGYKNNGIRIMDTLRGKCRFCDCNIWKETPKYLKWIKSYKLNQATTKAYIILDYTDYSLKQ